MMTGPRAATQGELNEIAAAVAGEEVGHYHDEAHSQLKYGAAVAVFDGYISDGPGYCGKVAMVVWSGGPDLFDVFTWDAIGCKPQEKTQ